MYLYLQIAQKLRDQIRSGVLKPGDQIPSGLALAQAEKIAAATALKALGHLAGDGWIVGDKTGYWVSDEAAQPPQRPAFTHRLDEMEAKLGTALARIDALEAGQAGPSTEQQPLERDPGDPYWDAADPYWVEPSEEDDLYDVTMQSGHFRAYQRWLRANNLHLFRVPGQSSTVYAVGIRDFGRRGPTEW